MHYSVSIVHVYGSYTYVQEGHYVYFVHSHQHVLLWKQTFRLLLYIYIVAETFVFKTIQVGVSEQNTQMDIPNNTGHYEYNKVRYLLGGACFRLAPIRSKVKRL